ncbi:hypothetical protein Hamer_G004093 [Homarus americanus]|uniref:Uncharacterized protein n=1 Tax=Homarus americanus TaxID=6706 RepID=A0A8J5JKS7_HOMAM|nr:hypothetical protein Hamer_G004093 [Homarus americanus]
MELQRRVCVAVWVFTLAVLVICTPVPQEEGDGSSSGGLRQEQCPLGEEVEMLEGGSGRRVVVAPVVGGLGAAAARTSCHTHQAKPLFLNTQQDADILYKLLKVPGTAMTDPVSPRYRYDRPCESPYRYDRPCESPVPL